MAIARSITYLFPKTITNATIGNKIIPDKNLFIFMICPLSYFYSGNSTPLNTIYSIILHIIYFPPNLRFLASKILIASSKSFSVKSGQYLSINRNSVYANCHNR